MNNDGAGEIEDAKAAPDTQARVGSPSVSGSGLAQLEDDEGAQSGDDLSPGHHDDTHSDLRTLRHGQKFTHH